MDDGQALELLGPVGIEMPLHSDVIDRCHNLPPLPSTAEFVLLSCVQVYSHPVADVITQKDDCVPKVRSSPSSKRTRMREGGRKQGHLPAVQRKTSWTCLVNPQVARDSRACKSPLFSETVTCFFRVQSRLKGRSETGSLPVRNCRCLGFSSCLTPLSY